MRFGSLSERGYSLMAVCGSKFNAGLLPARSALPLCQAPDLARAALQAVRRARLISYMERKILSGTAFRDSIACYDERDDHCIHLILHRDNCLHGAIRCQFHRIKPESGDPSPLFVEILNRNLLPEEIKFTIFREIDKMGTNSPSCLETSGWLANPDLRKNAALALALPSAVWALGAGFPEFPGISTLRASNGAAKTLARLGAMPLRYQERDLAFQDSFYRGPVQLMAMHSRRYHPEIDPLVQECLAMLLRHGLVTH